MAYNLPLNIPLINVMETLTNQFNVEINVLNVNRQEWWVLRWFWYDSIIHNIPSFITIQKYISHNYQYFAR